MMKTTFDHTALPYDVNAVLSRLAHMVWDERSLLSTLGDDAIADWLYANWYTLPAAPFDDSSLLPNCADLSAAVRAALEEPACWEQGWVALQVESGQRCIAGRSTLRRLVESGDYANIARPGMPVAPGDGLAVFSILAWIDPPTGFLGVRSHKAEPTGDLVRVYLSVSPAQVCYVLRELVSTLDRVGPAWSIKCPSQAAEYGRVDSLVVYLERDCWQAFETDIVRLGRTLASRLRDSVPPLACIISRGVAYAEDTTVDGPSFGQSRCAALVTGIRRVVREPKYDVLHAVEWLAGALESHGINPVRPWQCSTRVKDNPTAPVLQEVAMSQYNNFRIGLHDTVRRASFRSVLDLHTMPQLAVSTAITPHSTSPLHGVTSSYLKAAMDIGQRLRANIQQRPEGPDWNGDDLIGDDPANVQVVHGSTGLGLYSGAAGIGWFLSHLGLYAGDTDLLQCGVGALASALTRSRADLTEDTLSLYGGASGVALVAMQVGQCIADPSMRYDAESLACAVAQRIIDGDMPVEVDLIGGLAGIIIALAALHHFVPQTRELIEACRVAGERLLDKAISDVSGAYWPEQQVGADTLGLCGLAHGASGIAWALLGASDVTGDKRFAVLAREAMRYERSWFSAKTSNWPDLRGGRAANDVPRAMIAWCHGSIGIAALRLHLYQYSGDLQMLAEAGAGIHSARSAAAAARRALETGQSFDVSLCHGLGGAVELFTLAHEVTGISDHARAARRTADLCLELFHANDGCWTNGLSGATNVPGLLVGEAGIGAMMLRLHHPNAIGSPLLPGRGYSGCWKVSDMASGSA